jgi:hypothetical protein
MSGPAVPSHRLAGSALFVAAIPTSAPRAICQVFPEVEHLVLHILVTFLCRAACAFYLLPVYFWLLDEARTISPVGQDIPRPTTVFSFIRMPHIAMTRKEG